MGEAWSVGPMVQLFAVASAGTVPILSLCIKGVNGGVSITSYSTISAAGVPFSKAQAQYSVRV